MERTGERDAVIPAHVHRAEAALPELREVKLEQVEEFVL